MVRKVWYLLLQGFFWLLLPKFNFWKGDWALGYVSTQIWNFPTISLFPKILSFKLFCNSWGNSDTKVCCTRYHILFYLWLIGSGLKHCKVPNIMTKIVWKFSFCSHHFQWWFKFLEKVFICFKNVISAKKTTNKWQWKFTRVNFWPKLNMQNTAYPKPLHLEA